jgi:hypothetical protein
MTYPTAMDATVKLQMTTTTTTSSIAASSSSTVPHSMTSNHSHSNGSTPLLATMDVPQNHHHHYQDDNTTMTIIMKPEPEEYYIYHERQHDLMCGKHALNALCQMGQVFTASDLYAIAQRLDQMELDLMADNDEGGRMAPAYLERVSEGSIHANHHHSGSDGDSLAGNFSIDVLRIALQEKYQLELPNIKQEGLVVVGGGSGTGTDNANTNTSTSIQDAVTQMEGFICHAHSHWYAIRKINGVYWNLDSMQAKPRWMSHVELVQELQQLLQLPPYDNNDSSSYSSSPASVFCVPKGLPTECSTYSQYLQRRGEGGTEHPTNDSSITTATTTTAATTTPSSSWTWWKEHDLLLRSDSHSHFLGHYSTGTVVVDMDTTDSMDDDSNNHNATNGEASSWRSGMRLIYSKLTTTTTGNNSSNSSSSSQTASPTASQSSSSSSTTSSSSSSLRRDWEWSEEMARVALDQFAEPYSTYADGVVTFQYHHLSSAPPGAAAATGWVSVWN